MKSKTNNGLERVMVLFLVLFHALYVSHHYKINYFLGIQTKHKMGIVVLIQFLKNDKDHALMRATGLLKYIEVMEIKYTAYHGDNSIMHQTLYIILK